MEKIMTKAIFTAIILMTSLLSNFSYAAEIEVLMLNKGEKGAMVFEPDLIMAKPGDSIKFVPTDKGHNVQSIKGMLPEGVEKFKSKLNKEFVLNVEAEGMYGIKCTPHYNLGMVALVIVGNPTNSEAAKSVKQKGKAKGRFAEIFTAFGATQ